MRTGCCGSCREGRDPCTMPGTCFLVIPSDDPPPPWWRDRDILESMAVGLAVAVAAVAGLAAILGTAPAV